MDFRNKSYLLQEYLLHNKLDVADPLLSPEIVDMMWDALQMRQKNTSMQTATITERPLQTGSHTGPHLGSSGPSLDSIAGYVPLHGMGFPLATASRGSIPDKVLADTLSAYTTAPLIESPINFEIPSGPLEIRSLVLYYEEYESYETPLPSGLPPIPYERIPSYETTIAYVPLVRVPDDSSGEGYVHLHHFHQFIEYSQRKGVRLRRKGVASKLNDRLMPPEPRNTMKLEG